MNVFPIEKAREGRIGNVQRRCSPGVTSTPLMHPEAFRCPVGEGYLSMMRPFSNSCLRFGQVLFLFVTGSAEFTEPH